MQHAEIAGKEVTEFIPQDNVLRPHVAGPRSRAIGARSGLYALAFCLAGTVLFLLGGLGTVAFLTDRHCGPAFGYYGCEIPARQ